MIGDSERLNQCWLWQVDSKEANLLSKKLTCYSEHSEILTTLKSLR
jgi:hypothetical protein